eukprot:9455875-Pyramimonas_sp.AAC.1
MSSPRRRLATSLGGLPLLVSLELLLPRPELLQHRGVRLLGLRHVLVELRGPGPAAVVERRLQEPLKPREVWILRAPPDCALARDDPPTDQLHARQSGQVQLIARLEAAQ